MPEKGGRQLEGRLQSQVKGRLQLLKGDEGLKAQFLHWSSQTSRYHLPYSDQTKDSFSCLLKSITDRADKNTHAEPAYYVSYRWEMLKWHLGSSAQRVLDVCIWASDFWTAHKAKSFALRLWTTRPILCRSLPDRGVEGGTGGYGSFSWTSRSQCRGQQSCL